MEKRFQKFGKKSFNGNVVFACVVLLALETAKLEFTTACCALNFDLFKAPHKYVNIPSEKYIYVHKYVYICVYTYLCKMDEHRSYAGLS